MRLRTKYVNVEIHVRKILVTNNVVVKIGSCLERYDLQVYLSHACVNVMDHSFIMF